MLTPIKRGLSRTLSLPNLKTSSKIQNSPGNMPLSLFEEGKNLKLTDPKKALKKFEGAIKEGGNEAPLAMQELTDLICADSKKYYERKHDDSLYKAACVGHMGAATLLHEKLKISEAAARQLGPDVFSSVSKERLEKLTTIIEAKASGEINPESRHTTFKLEESERGRRLGRKLKKLDVETKPAPNLVFTKIVSESEDATSGERYSILSYTVDLETINSEN